MSQDEVTQKCSSPRWQNWLLHLSRGVITPNLHRAQKAAVLKSPATEQIYAAFLHFVFQIKLKREATGSYAPSLISSSSSAVLFDWLSLTDQVLSWPRSYLLTLLASFPVWMGLLSCWCYVGGQGLLLSQEWGPCPGPDGGLLQCWRSGWCTAAQAPWKAAHRSKS